MRMKISNSLLMIMFAMLIMNPTTLAQNYQFVDAEGTTGYYVDMDTVKIENKEMIAATIAVVKARLNKMYVYDVKINHKDFKYQILSSKIMEYDTKTVLDTNERVRSFRPYSEKSEMSAMVRFILYGDEQPTDEK